MELKDFEDVITRIKYKDWNFHVICAGEFSYLQASFLDGKGEQWRSRKWLLSRHMTVSEFVQTCLKAVLTAEEHEAREAFTYRGVAIFGPHHNIEGLLGLMQEKRKTTIG